MFLYPHYKHACMLMLKIETVYITHSAMNSIERLRLSNVERVCVLSRENHKLIAFEGSRVMHANFQIYICRAQMWFSLFNIILTRDLSSLERIFLSRAQWWWDVCNNTKHLPTLICVLVSEMMLSSLAYLYLSSGSSINVSPLHACVHRNAH